jgi:hypothetical protein
MILFFNSFYMLDINRTNIQNKLKPHLFLVFFRTFIYELIAADILTYEIKALSLLFKNADTTI